MAVLIIITVFCLSTGCAHTRAGLAREQAAYTAGTNFIAGVQPVVRYAPPPFNSLAEAFLAAMTAGLTAWNASQHRRIKQLETRTNGAKPTPAT